MNEHELRVYCMIQEIVSQREGMIAENQVRAHRGESPAYAEDAFAVLTETLMKIRQAM